MRFDHFDFIAPLYHRIGLYRHIEKMLSFADLPTTGRLLDAGGGTGRVANVLRAHAKQTVVADVSLGMLRFAASVPALQVVSAPSERLPFADRSFERVVMVDTLHHVLDQGQTACELWRVLKPGGRIVIEEPDIRMFGVRLIALAEKLLLMRSHFLAADQIAQLFEFAAARTAAGESTVWVILEKNELSTPETGVGRGRRR